MTEREELLEEAKALGLEFAKNAKTENIKKAVLTAKVDKAAADTYREAAGLEEVREEIAPSEAEIRAKLELEFAEKLESERAKMMANMEVNMAAKSEESSSKQVSFGQARLKSRKEALKLIRVVITVKDPAKQSWEGEIISAGNDVIGEVKKFVPYMNAEDGYHLPQIILNVLKDKMCTVFVNRKGADGKMLKEAKQIRAYSFEYLEPLTIDELTELGRSQTDRQALG